MKYTVIDRECNILFATDCKLILAHALNLRCEALNLRCEALNRVEANLTTQLHANGKPFFGKYETVVVDKAE